MTRPDRQPNTTPRRTAMAGLAAAALLVACSSATPPRFHTLTPAPAPLASSTATIRNAPAGTLAWEVLAVSVPAQVDQPQWVVRTVDGSLAVLEQERWIAPLADEIRAAVVGRLTQALGAPADAGKRWQVRIDVQRFESSPGRETRLDALWTVGVAGDAASTLRCRSELVQPIVPGDSGYLVLAKSHQQGVAQLADVIAKALKARSAGQAGACGG